MKTRVPNIFPRLDPPGISRIAIIGEAPGKNEEEQGAPFVGQSGQLLNAALSQVGIVRDQCFVGNVVNLRPQSNDINSVDWNSEDVQSSIAQLREDLIKFRPSIILCLGNAALFLMKRGASPGPRKTRQKRKQEGGEDDTELSAPEHGAQGDPATEGLGILTSHETLQSGSFLWPDKIGSWRGSLFESGWLKMRDLDSDPNKVPACPSIEEVATLCFNRAAEVMELGERGVKCLATFHPAAVLRDFSLQPLFRLDLKRLAEESKTRELVLPKRKITVIAPNQPGIMLTDLHKIQLCFALLKEAGKPVATDIEGYISGVTCMSFSNTPNFATVIPFAHADGTSVWSEDEEVAIWEEVKKFLEDPAIEKVYQNGLYDCFVLAWTHGITVRNFAYDTMVGMFECFAELPKGLATQASILTKEPFYKPDKGEEGEMKFASDEEFWRYNGIDACVTLECHEKQMALMNEGQKAHYAFNMQLMPALLYMEIRGMKWASDEAAVAREEALRKAYEMQARIDEEACRALASNSDNWTEEIVDLNCLYCELTEFGPHTEKNFASLCASQLCQKNIKRPVEVVEERWQPMSHNGKKWVKNGKRTETEYKSLHGVTHVGEEPPLFDGMFWYKPCHKKVTKNQPFSPSTLAECEEFVLESRRTEWQRVQEIWKELNDEREQIESPSVAENRSVSNTVKIGDERKLEDGHTDEIRRGSSLDSGADRPETGNVCETVYANAGQSRGEPDKTGVDSSAASRSHLLGELSTLLSLAINVGSTQADGDAQRFLYGICGFKEQFKKQKGKKTDKVSSDQNALVKLYGDTRDVRVLWVLQLRRLRKLATDLALEVDDDGRLRSTFSLVKETGRMSASASPTGKGTNAQALNKDLRYLVKADPGCQLRQRDLEGADSWTVACHCAALGDDTMLLDLKAGLKPAQALCVMFDKPEAAAWGREELKSYFKENKKRFSVWHYPALKAVVHGSSYLMGIKTMLQTVLKNSMAELPLELSEAQPMTLTHAQGEAFQRLFFVRYKGIVKWHAKSSATLIRDGSIKTSAGHLRRFYGRKKEFKNGQWIANHDTLKEFLASEPQFWTTWATKKALWRMWYDEENRLSECRESDSMGQVSRSCGALGEIQARDGSSGSRERNVGFSRGSDALRCEPLFAVHDSLLTQCREEDAAWCEAKEKEWFNNPIEVAGISVVVPSEQKSGRNWGDYSKENNTEGLR